MRRPKASGAEAGFTLIEVLVGAVITGVIIYLATSTSSSISGVASHGLRKLQVEADCQELLHFLANDLQNSSSDSDPDTLLPRFLVEDSNVVEELVSVSTIAGVKADATEKRVVTEDECLEQRPRSNVYQWNSIFRFQKVHDLDIDTESGEVTPIWSVPISYYLRNRLLVREEDGRRRVIATDVTVFRVVAESQGNFRIFVRIQKRNPTSGEVMTASGMIEINPKNS